MGKKIRFAAQTNRVVIRPSIKNETARLRKVVLGLAEDFGGEPALEEAYDPKSKEHIRKGTFPTQEAVSSQVKALENVLLKHGVEVYRPLDVKDVNQIFARDIGLVIDNKFIVPNIIIERRQEVEALDNIISQIPEENILWSPDNVRMEGGDVMPWNEVIFVGYSKKEDFKNYKVSRTNEAGVEFLKQNFPDREVIAIELAKSDKDPRQNALHLDCTFQPIGDNKAIVFRGGFKYESDYQKIVDYFGEDNLVHIDREEMYHMNSNIFSISPEVIISDSSFERLNGILKDMGFTVEEVEYDEVAKMEGLLGVQHFH